VRQGRGAPSLTVCVCRAAPGCGQGGGGGCMQRGCDVAAPRCPARAAATHPLVRCCHCICMAGGGILSSLLQNGVVRCWAPSTAGCACCVCAGHWPDPLPALRGPTFPPLAAAPHSACHRVRSLRALLCCMHACVDAAAARVAGTRAFCVLPPFPCLFPRSTPLCGVGCAGSSAVLPPPPPKPHTPPHPVGASYSPP
jgi:hypothetical protein